MKENILNEINNSNLRGWKKGPVYYEMVINGLSFTDATKKVFSEDYNALIYNGLAMKAVKEFISSWDGQDATFIYCKNMLAGQTLAEIYILIDSEQLTGKINTDATFNRLVSQLVSKRNEELKIHREEMRGENNE